MSDGTISRYMYVGASAHKASNVMPMEILSVQPNIVHILIVARLLAQYKPIFVFAQHPEEDAVPTSGLLLTVPLDIEEARQHILNPIPTTETMLLLKPNVTVAVKETDHEYDGTILSARNVIRRIIDFEHEKSLQTDANGNSFYTPLQRAFQRKSSNKLARLAGICQTISYAVQLCTECINMVRFGDGLFLKEFIDDEQLRWLNKFHDKIKELTERDISKAPKYGGDQRPLLFIEKPAVHASEILFQYTATTISTLFDATSLNATESTKNDNKFSKNDQILKR
ncbi:unnamed protein product [Didymodactylos carnosus]|uniref:Uncharacterized protein n=1 Tax=Didymodactylos carnosus TaxID=1234261 RepID=A0A8S2Q219_9BILA|nr:unnamed protein product [Didymodactylos carnosus]CAF4083106.1 unnamed protein product [Didymodactylos carnosus]